MQFDARLPDAQAALSELEYTSPVNVSADRIEVVVDDRGHTGAGGNKSDALEINVALHAGAANTAPRLTMWPENRGARVLPQSLGAAAAREAPLGVEFALHGLYLEDEDNLDGLMQVAARTCPCAPMQGRLLQLQQPQRAVDGAQGEAQSAGGQLGENVADNFIVGDNRLAKKNFPLVINFHSARVNDFSLLGETQHMLGGKAQFGTVASD